MNKYEALKMAIEVMYRNSPKIGLTQEIEEAINACKEALEQPAQEPVAYTNADEMQELKDGMSTCYMYKERLDADCIPLYTHPYQWQGLAADELEDIKDNSKEGWYQLVRNVEQALKEKNHG
jgi:hypothetical protein